MVKKVKAAVEPKLEDILFSCRNSLRGRAPMTDKRDLLLTLVFLKFINDKFVKVRRGIEAEYGGDEVLLKLLIDKPESYQREGVFYLEPECRWDVLAALNAKDMALAFDEALAKLERSYKSLKNALPLQIFTKTDLEPSVLKAVVDEINKIDSERFKEKDLIGRVYEYFLQAFSINADKEEGEFYTPHSIVELIATLIEPFDGPMYDPCCGSGGMFVQCAKLVEAQGGNTSSINVYGQESEPSTFRLAKMNLAVRGISFNLGDKAVSTFTNDQHPDLKVKYIMANPPFNLKKWRTADTLLDDARWKGYALPPESNANYAWILHMLSKLDEREGVAGFLLANGALDDGDTLAIRRKLIENDKVEAIIVLPREMFYSTDISVTLWILNNNKRGGLWHGRQLRDRRGEVLFVDLRTWNENVYEKKFVKLSGEQIGKVKEIYCGWQSLGVESGERKVESGERKVESGSEKVDGKWVSCYEKAELYYAAGREELAEKGYSLVPSRYIEFVDRDTEMDYDAALTKMSAEFAALNERWEQNKETMVNAFKVLGYGK